jgi:hypothetical protein
MSLRKAMLEHLSNKNIKQVVFDYILPTYFVNLACWGPREVETYIDIYKKLCVDGNLFIYFYVTEHNGMHNFKISLS